MSKKNNIWITTAYRWGDRSNHSYVVGVFTKKHKAIKEAEEEEEHRGGKYGCMVVEGKLDEVDRNELKEKIIRFPYGKQNWSTSSSAEK